MDQETRVFCAVAAALPMAIGGLLALNLPMSFLALIAMVALIRLGWVDDNIANDLLKADRLPTGYANTVRRRQTWAWRLFGVRPRTEPCAIDPAMLATRYRAEAQVLQTGILTGLAVSTGGSLPMPLGFVFLVITFGGAWRQMDRLFVTIGALERGEPLSPSILASRTRWAACWLPEDR